MTVFLTLVICGIILVAVEIFIPGGVLGTLGGIALLAAAVAAFSAFGPQVGMLVATGMLVLIVVCLIIWIKYFPKTPMGKSLTLSKDARAFKLDDSQATSLLGQTGIAHTDLRPSGIAFIGGHRLDVVAEGQWIEKNKSVKIIEAAGNHITVREVQAPPEAGDQISDA